MRGNCAICGQTVHIRKNGTARVHYAGPWLQPKPGDYQGDYQRRCKGSGDNLIDAEGADDDG